MKEFLIVVIIFVLAVLVMFGLARLNCLGEAPGTMAVMGGNSYRC